MTKEEALKKIADYCSKHPEFHFVEPIPEPVVYESVEIHFENPDTTGTYYMTNDFKTLCKKLNSLGYFEPIPFQWTWNPYLDNKIRVKMEELNVCFAMSFTDGRETLSYYSKRTQMPLYVDLHELKVANSYLVEIDKKSKPDDKILSAEELAGRRKWSGLMLAAHNNSTELAKYLINKKADVNFHDEYGLTPLMFAVLNKNKELVKILIDAGADVNACTKSGFNILTYAILTNENDSLTEIIKMLGNAGGEIRELEQPSKTPGKKLSFNETLSFFISQVTFGGFGKTNFIYENTQINGSGGLSKQTFSKIRSNTNPDYHPKKKTVFLLAIGMSLSLPQCEALLESAGYFFDEKDKFDMILKDFIKKRNFNMEEIEKKLFDETGDCLGNWGR